MKNREMINNLYKILRMNIMLAKSNGELITEDTIQSFDDAAKKMDEDNNNKYEADIKGLYYSTKTLEEESIRLDKLIDLIDKRINDRNGLLLDYRDITGRDLEALGYIKDEDKVESYRRRLNNIKKYLSNKENIAKLESELVDLHSELDNHYEEKKSNEKNNSNLEEELLKEFKDSLGGTDYSKIVEASDIDSELDILKPEVEEQFKTLNTFDNAYHNLLRAGISYESENEYAGYVEDAKKVYYDVKEKEFLYRIFKVIKDSKSIYSDLYDKRGKLDQLLDERFRVREELSISKDDILSNLYKVIDKQNKIIVKEKHVIDEIDEIEDTIKFKETRLNELKEDNRSVDVLALLQEFGIIDTYKVDIIEKSEDVQATSDEKDSALDNNENDYGLPNMVIQIKDAYQSLNVGFARSKADTVMRRVGRSLGYTPEVKKENIVSYDFNNDVGEKETKEPVNNSLSNLNLDDLNLNLKLDNNEQVDEKIDNNSVNPIFPDLNNNVVAPIFPDSNVNTSEVKPIFPNVAVDNGISNEENDLDKDIDKDFWSAEEDKEIFPSVLKDNNISVEKEESGFKLGNPINIGGYDENRN